MYHVLNSQWQYMWIPGVEPPPQMLQTECDLLYVLGEIIGNRGPDARAIKPLEMVNTDLACPINPVSKEGLNYCIAITDNYSGVVFVYFLKNKNDTVQATEKFLADCSPYNQVKCIRSDNGSEFKSNTFQTLLRKRAIKQQTSSPYSPHQNGTLPKGIDKPCSKWVGVY